MVFIAASSVPSLKEFILDSIQIVLDCILDTCIIGHSSAGLRVSTALRGRKRNQDEQEVKFRG